MISHSIDDVFKAFKVPFTTIDALIKNGFSVAGDTTTLSFYKSATKMATINLAKGAIDMALAGELGENSISHVSQVLETTAQKLLNGAPNPVTNPFVGVDTKYKVDPTSPPEWKSIDMHKPAGTSMVSPLSTATKLFQSVHGTSAGSVYFVVAISPKLKLAARYKGNSLSIRAEGDLIAYTFPLNANGFDITKNSHASFHVEVPTDLMAARVVGAVIGGLGIAWELTTADMMAIHDKKVK